MQKGRFCEKCRRKSGSAQRRNLLLIDWLNALVYEMATRRMLFGAFVVTIEDSRLHAREAVHRVPAPI